MSPRTPPPVRAAALALALACAACEVGVVERRVALTAVDGWPRAQTAVLLDALRVRVSKMERLRGDVALTAWARGHHGPSVRLGVVEPGGATTFYARTTGVDWVDVHELVITQEAAAEVPRVASPLAVFWGLPDGPLSFAGAGHLATTAAEVRVVGDELRLTATNVPPLGGRAWYGAWLVDPRASQAEARASATPLGRLGADGRLVVTGLAAPALPRAVAVTIEFDDGVPEPALESVVLWGVIPATAEPTPDAAAPPWPAPPDEATHGH